MRNLYKNRCGLLYILMMCLLCVSCLPEDLELSRVKDVVTTGVGAVFSYGAKLSGVVTLVESADVECGIIYGRSTPFVEGESVRVACEDYTIVQVSDDSFECCFSVSIAGLMPNTTYYYCAYALDAGQYKFGEMFMFTTEIEYVATGEVISVTDSVATLCGIVNCSGQTVTCGIMYGTSSMLSYGLMMSTSSAGSYSVRIQGLTANTTYYYRAYVIVNDEYKYGEVRSFTTLQENGGNISSYEAIDLGLSVKWSSFNVGACSPEEYGDYFAWGETSPKSSYYQSNSITCGLSIEELESRGIIDSDGQLTAAYDAATANWGESWRMPTKAEQDELRTNCTWTWTAQNGVNGYKVTGPNGNSIFLPAAGYCYDTSLGSAAGSYGLYWSATPDSGSSYAYYLYYGSDFCDWYYFYRYCGRTVRPVSER